MHGTKPLPGLQEVLIREDQERRAYRKRSKDGVPVSQEVVTSFLAMGEYTRMDLGNF